MSADQNTAYQRLMELAELIRRGVELTCHADLAFEDHLLAQLTDDAQLVLTSTVHRSFIIWCEDVRLVLFDVYDRKVHKVSLLYEGHGVPLVKAGPEYANPKSPKSLLLFTNIRLATEKILVLLREGFEVVEASGIKPIEVLISRKGISIGEKLYPVRGKRAELLKLIKVGPISAATLLKERGGTKQLLSREIKDINENFQKKCGVKHDLILSLPGYYFNNIVFDVVHEDNV